jgi:RHS repeat-associated protein
MTYFTYDANGNLSSYKDPTGALTQIQRDSKGNITSVTDPLGHTVQYSYDQYNNLISATDPTNVTVNLTRDILGNVLSLTDALNNTSSFSYNANSGLTAAADPLGNAISLTYDKDRNTKSVTDPLQNLTTYTYDYRGRPTRQVNALGKTTSFSYVATGCQSCGGGGEKLTSLTDPVGSTTNFAYDLRGLLTGITDPLQEVTTLSYDVNGRLTNSTDRNGTALAYAYTPTWKLSSITYPNQTQVTYSYDSLDRLTGLQDSIGTSSFTYDADGRITGFTDPNGFALSYIYDAAGNITQIKYPDGTAVAYAFDAANRLTTVTDWLGEQATYAYDQDGRLASSTHFNGIVTNYTYDAASRLTGIASAVSSYQFTLDGDGNRVNSTESQPINATASNGVSAVYAYNAQKNRLFSAGPLSYAYDNEGQLVNSGGTCLTFDYNHRLVEIGDDTQFSYDGRGNRLIATRSAVTTVYIYDPWGNLIATADGSGNITAKYIYGKGLLALATPSGRYCYHFNGTASTIAITDMNQNIVNSYAYDPFGQILGQQETIPQPFKYVGQYGVMAEPNGLYYMRARYYDPSVGRFISEDPLGFGGGDVNLFAYTRNNPANRIDPLGLSDVGITSYEGRQFYWMQPRGLWYSPETDQLSLDGIPVEIVYGVIPIGGPSSSVLMNAARGLEFEASVIEALGATKNTIYVTVQGLGKSIPDLMCKGITEIKSGMKIYFTRQLQIQAAASEGEGPFSLIVGPQTQSISGPLQSAVARSGGTIQVFDPLTGAFSPWAP